MIERILAGLVLAVCVALLLRMALPEAPRRRLDVAWQRLLHGGRRLGRGLWRGREDRQRAEREAEALIRRAQRGPRRDGRAGAGESFKRPDKPH